MPSGDVLAPSYIKLYYESVNAPHVMTVPVNLVDPGVPGGTFELFTKNNAEIDWVTGLTAYITALKPNVHSGTVFQYAELYSQPFVDSAPVFQATTVLSIAGTGATPTLAASQTVWSCRTDLGGKMFVYLMDAIWATNQKHKAPAYGAAGILGLVTYLLSANNIVIGRDNGYPVVVTKVLTKTNDALRRRYRIN